MAAVVAHALSVFPAQFLSAAPVVDTIRGVRLDQLHPTQPSIGYDEIYFKLQRFENDSTTLFEAFCELNGQGGVRDVSAASDLRDPASFVCKDPVGAHPEWMSAAVIAPNNQLYLTDGHHKCTELWEAAGGGPALSIYVVVKQDYSALPSMAAFWSQLRKSNNVWLFDGMGTPVLETALPGSLALNQFNDDPYRSMLHFLNHIAWEKPEPAIAFAEFYWAREVRKKVNLEHYDLATTDGYIEALRVVSDAVTASDSTNVGGSGKTALAMGRRPVIKPTKWDRAVRHWKSVLPAMLAFKATRGPCNISK